MAASALEAEAADSERVNRLDKKEGGGEVVKRPRFSLGGQVSAHRAASTSSLHQVEDLLLLEEQQEEEGGEQGFAGGQARRRRAAADRLLLFDRPLLRQQRKDRPPFARSAHSLLLPCEEDLQSSPFRDHGHNRMSSNPADQLKSLNPELLLREFTRDELETTASPSSMFKSSFAREVVQNVRKSLAATAGGQQQSGATAGAPQNVEFSPVTTRKAAGSKIEVSLHQG